VYKGFSGPAPQNAARTLRASATITLAAASACSNFWIPSPVAMVLMAEAVREKGVVSWCLQRCVGVVRACARGGARTLYKTLPFGTVLLP